MSNLNELNARIDELKVDIGLAEAADAAASLAVAHAPNDDALRRAREASAHLANLRGDMLVLTNARAAAEAEASSEEVQAQRREAVTVLSRAEQLQVKRIEAAKTIDRALAALQIGTQKWVAVNAELRAEAVNFYRLAMPRSTKWHQHIYGLSDLQNGILNSFADQVDRAVQGLNTSHNLALNFVRDANSASTVFEAERSGAGVLATMRRIGKNEGLPL